MSQASYFIPASAIFQKKSSSGYKKMISNLKYKKSLDKCPQKKVDGSVYPDTGEKFVQVPSEARKLVSAQRISIKKAKQNDIVRERLRLRALGLDQLYKVKLPALGKALLSKAQIIVKSAQKLGLKDIVHVLKSDPDFSGIVDIIGSVDIEEIVKALQAIFPKETTTKLRKFVQTVDEEKRKQSSDDAYSVDMSDFESVEGDTHSFDPELEESNFEDENYEIIESSEPEVRKFSIGSLEEMTVPELIQIATDPEATPELTDEQFEYVKERIRVQNEQKIVTTQLNKDSKRIETMFNRLNTFIQKHPEHGEMLMKLINKNMVLDKDVELKRRLTLDARRINAIEFIKSEVRNINRDINKLNAEIRNAEAFIKTSGQKKVGGSLNNQMRNNAYKLTKNMMFGELKLDPSAFARLRLKGSKNGQVVINEPTSIELVDLITKRFNPKIKHDTNTLLQFKKLVLLSNLPVHVRSGKYQLFNKAIKIKPRSSSGRSVRGGNCIIINEKPLALIKKLSTICAEIQAGNDNPRLVNQGSGICDYLLKNRVINKKEHKALMNNIIM